MLGEMHAKLSASFQLIVCIAHGCHAASVPCALRIDITVVMMDRCVALPSTAAMLMGFYAIWHLVGHRSAARNKTIQSGQGVLERLRQLTTLKLYISMLYDAMMLCYAKVHLQVYTGSKYIQHHLPSRRRKRQLPVVYYVFPDSPRRLREVAKIVTEPVDFRLEALLHLLDLTGRSTSVD